MPTEREQKLCQAWWEMLYAATKSSPEWFKDKTSDEIAAWACKTLTDCGLPAHSIGAARVRLINSEGK